MDRTTDYLERLFIEELNSEGEIIISGNSFFRHEILYTLDPEAYKDVFEFWKTERKQRNLNEANRILDITSDNRNRFIRLKELFKEKKIIPFIGAGMSMSTGLTSWSEFLRSVQQETRTDRFYFEDLLSQGEFEEAAQYLDDCSPSHLQEQLDNIFGRKYLFNEINGVICLLPKFFNNTPIITTNYDNILSTVYQKCDYPFSDELNGLYLEDLYNKLLDKQNFLLKIHGTFDKPQNRILTKNDYDKHYNDQTSKLKNCVESLFSSSLLFIGCSLTIDRLIKALAEIVQEKGSENLPRHYAFLFSDPKKDVNRINKKEELAKSNIFPIWYDGDHDESIEALLELLNDGEQ
ncbi:SIR2 family protein [Haemophilus influenzae]|uniref:SIR2 family protein n=1 Tax=Haemophilus influenzae TaxID=727 RepID=UPI00071D1C26|nr:SIR2 family protein [Haemophilus influenzae]UEB31410.1 SIR2 family protein [Haemophilus influenzae]